MGLYDRESKSEKNRIITIIVLTIIILIIVVGIAAMGIIFKKITYTEPVAIVTTTTTSSTTTTTISITTTTSTTTTTTTTIIVAIVKANCYKDSDCGVIQNMSICSEDRSQVIKKSIQPMCMNPATEGAYCWNRTTIAGIISCTDVKTDSEGKIIRQSRCLSGGCTKI